MASKTTYLRYPPQQDPSEDILNAISLQKARADEAAALANHQMKQAKADQLAAQAPAPTQESTQPPVDQPPTQAPTQPQFSAQMAAAQVQQPKGDPQQQELIKRLEAAYEEGIKKQGADVGDISQLAEAQARRSQHTQTDLTPTLNYLSNISGIDIAKGYTPPESGGDQRKELYGLLKEKMTGSQNISKDQVGMLKDLLMANKDSKDSDRQARFDKAQGYRMQQDAQKGDKELAKNYANFTQQASNVSDAFKPDEQGNVSATRVNSAMSQFARMMGERGVLTDNDVARVLYKDAAFKMAELSSKFKPGAKVNVQNVHEAIDAYNNAVESFKKAHEAEAGSFVNNLTMPGSYYEGQPFVNGFVKQANDRVNQIGGLKIDNGMHQSVAAPKGPGASSLQDAAKQELMRRKSAQ